MAQAFAAISLLVGRATRAKAVAKAGPIDEAA
jgi:hypothetical protein